MIIVTQAPLLLILLFLAGLTLAAVEDVWRRRVSNIAVALVALSGIAAFIMTGHGLRLWEPVAIAVAVLAVGTVLFARGVVGGGDVKLLAAGCFWYVLRGQLTYLSAAFLMGGVLAVAVLLYRWARRRFAGKGLGKVSVGIPYAVAIASGAAWTLLRYRFG